MNINGFDVDISDKILIITSKYKNVTLSDLIEIKTLIEQNINHKYEYGMYRDIVGYYVGYDFIKGDFVYCGSRQKKDAINFMKLHEKGYDGF